MKKFVFPFILLALSLNTLFAQKKNKKTEEPLKIIFQLTTDDTLAHKALMKQLSNITSIEPGVQIEVVCHGPGLTLLQKSKSTQKARVAEFASKGIAFKACEFSMSERNVPKDDIIDEAGFVKAGIVHIVRKQREGWNYIKSGF